MKIIEYKFPYHHITIDDFLPNDLFNKINNDLYDIECKIPSDDTGFERFSTWPACVPLSSGMGDYEYIDWSLHDGHKMSVINYINNFFDFKGTSLSEKLSNNFDWSGYFEIARDSFHPHTDNAWPNLIEDAFYAGIIKGVLYFGKENINYINYGTILLHPRKQTFVKEVEFKPNRLILFDTRDDSFHATDYHNEMKSKDKVWSRDNIKKFKKLEHKRFSFNIEYTANDGLPMEEVHQLYKDINYPNSFILKQWNEVH